MAKYKAMWKEVATGDANILIEATARYISSVEYPDIDAIAAILGIEKIEDAEGV